MKIGVVLLSGGLDSTTLATLAKSQVNRLTALTVFYGQKHHVEIAAAEKVADKLGLRHEVVFADFFGLLAQHSALTSPDDFDIPKRSLGEISEGIPITYVPFRNLFFITLAATLLESEILDLIENRHVDAGELSASIFIAANAIDYSGYPDCRPEFYRDLEVVLKRGSKSYNEYGVEIKIEAPLITKSKKEIVEIAMQIEAPLKLTWSCYNSGPEPCRFCDSCVLRAKGFREAGILDLALR